MRCAHNDCSAGVYRDSAFLEFWGIGLGCDRGEHELLIVDVWSGDDLFTTVLGLVGKKSLRWAHLGN